MSKKKQNTKKAIRTRSPSLPRVVLAALQRLGVCHPGAKLGVAVSGGADSVALLRLLLEVREESRKQLRAEIAKTETRTFAPIEIAVVHFNHQLRKRASDADERFVCALAEKLGLEFYLATADVEAGAKRAKRNVEDVGRRERHAFFSRLVANGHLDYVATAHTMDDQAETVLAHLLRGTGLAGLAGIHPVSGAVIRPLLAVRRSQLREYLRARKQRWREDLTNQDTTRTRARIRKLLIPLLQKKFHSGVVPHLAELAERAREDEEFLNEMAAQKLEEGTKGLQQDASGALRIGVNMLVGDAAVPALSGRIVRKIVRKCKQRDGELGSLHVASVLELARSGENGKAVRLPGGVEVRRGKDALLFRAVPARTASLNAETAHRTGKDAIEYAYSLTPDVREQRVSLPLLMCAFRFRTIDWLRDRSETRSKWAALDSTRLQPPLILRSWQAGDRLQPMGRSRVYKLKRLLNKKGVNRWDRNGWPVLTSGGVIVWARGFAVAAAFAATDQTRTALVIDEESL